jgi:formylglycine-generating enzyme required for sulfatase activity
VQPVVSAPRLPEGWEALDATPGHGRWAKRAKEPKSGIVFVLVAPGEFEMGSPPKERDRKNDETLHHVTLTKAFYLAETETTQAQYRKVTRKNPSEFEGDDRPVESVTWNDAASFCKQIQCELPSEAQWEYACRAGKQEPFHFGATLPKNLANHNGDDNWEVARDGRGPQTFSVKKYKPNAWGLYDMHGNVWEWCADAYAPYPSSPVTDPLVTNGKERVNRGGSWKLAGRDSRSARRDKDTPDKEYDQLGFRCARTLPD